VQALLLLESAALSNECPFCRHAYGLPRKNSQARVYDVAIETPLDHAPALSARIGNRVLLKREDLQPVFSFKLRGAYNKIVHLSPERLKHGVICASAGNHAQGVALAAAKVGCRAVIVMPTTTPLIKVHAVRRGVGKWCWPATPTMTPTRTRSNSKSARR
jgi:threonine dehydratase